ASTDPSASVAAVTPAPSAASAGVAASPAGSVAPSAAGSGSAQPTGGPTGSPPADAVLIGAGDIADCSREGDEHTARLLDDLTGAVFTAGDNAYASGTAAQFRDCYGPTWGRHVARTRPAPGNHDWETQGLAGYLGYFGAAAAPNGTSWYSYDLGAWHIVVLDSDCEPVGGCDAGSAQGSWLAGDLSASRAQCTMAIWHHPRFSSGEHGNDATVAPFWRVVYDAGAEVVVNGHDHDYERFAPQDPDARADDARGLQEFVVGTGGAELRAFRTPVANSAVRVAAEFGVIRFVLHPTGLDWTFLATTGRQLDSGSAACH
ncbi:MAG TPA: metallophosphoesterase, partial [Candidatus Limnocylindria bacterium]|nr:metallophosphoesterase [Candidatus Limnocylindria bacterium]